MKTFARRVLAGAEDLLRVDVIPRRYWSPVPYDLPDSLWEEPKSMRGIDWDLERQAALHARIEPLMDGAQPGGMFGAEDARVLRGMIRYLDPKRVIELGSGHSTRVIAAAASGVHTVYDPFPDPELRATGGVAVVPTSATDLPLETFGQLEAGDVLFVDTSHTVKAGSDVNRIVLEVLPILEPGVWVHFHDIFLPYEYPRVWLTEKRQYWAEQYLLQAFLQFNEVFRVELALYALARDGRIEPRQEAPGSFWLRRRR